MVSSNWLSLVHCYTHPTVALQAPMSDITFKEASWGEDFCDRCFFSPLSFNFLSNGTSFCAHASPSRADLGVVLMSVTLVTIAVESHSFPYPSHVSSLLILHPP
jgi:hypothetical protein